MTPMQHPEREVTDRAEQLEILSACKVGRLGMVTPEGLPYVLPMNFAWRDDGQQLHIYLHGAHRGYKLEVLRQNPQVCFEADCDHTVQESRFPCAYTLCYRSVLGFGRAVIVEDVQEKIDALTLFMHQQTGKEYAFEEKHTRAVQIIRLDIDRLYGKRRFKK